MRSSLLQDKRQNCVQRLDLSTPIFYCQPNIFNIKRTVRDTMLLKLQLLEYPDKIACCVCIYPSNLLLSNHASSSQLPVWWTQYICYISCQNFTRFSRTLSSVYIYKCAMHYIWKVKSLFYSWFKSTTALHYKYSFMMWKLCCLIMKKYYWFMFHNQISNMSNIKYCFKSECYSSWTRMTVAQCPNMDRTAKLIGNNWDLRVEYGYYTWYASDICMIKLFEWSLYEKSIQVII